MCLTDDPAMTPNQNLLAKLGCAQFIWGGIVSTDHAISCDRLTEHAVCAMHRARRIWLAAADC